MTVTTEPAGPAVERRPVPEAVRRRLAPAADRRDGWSWVVAGLVTAVAAVIRLLHLERPGQIIFDEVYYAPNAYALLHYGVEWNVAEGGASPVDGAPVLGDAAAYVVHPPLGKWIIALGEWAFGYTPFGWRIAAAVAGIASVLLVTRIARRMFGSTVLGAAAGLLVALDGMHVVMSRTALLDIFLLFFLVAAFGALLLDRDQRRRRWLAALEDGLDPTRPGRAGRPPFDWRTGVPWWRLAAAALLGAACAVKWSAVFAVPVFAVLVVVWEVGARRSAGVPRPGRETALREVPWLLASAVLVPVVYLLSWAGWFATDHGYFRDRLAQLGQEQPAFWGDLVNLFLYHQQMWRFHSGLETAHQYESSPWQWLPLARPVAFHYSGEGECGAASCASEVLLLGTPLLWWAFLPALAVAAWIGLARRDWRVLPLLLMVGAMILPWSLLRLLEHLPWPAVGDRVMFYFYALPAEPFLVMLLVYVLGAVVSPRPARPGPFGVDRRVAGVALAASYVLLVAANFGYFYPIFTGQDIPFEAWQARMWLGDRWI